MSGEKLKLEKLLERRNQIESRIKQIEAKEKSKARKLETRRKILLGVICEKLIANDQIDNETITNAINSYLTTDRDRDLIKNYLAIRSDLPL